MFLTLNGVRVPVATWQRDFEAVGDAGRAFSGAYRSSRRALKRVWSIETAPLSRADAEALAAILQGRGDAWTFDDDLYSAKGNPLNGDGVVQSSVVKYGASALRLTGDGSAELAAESQKFPLAPGTPYTAMAWLRNDLSAGQFSLQVREYDEDGGFLASRSTQFSGSSWTFHSNASDWVSGPNARQAAVRLSISGTPTGSAYADDLIFIPADIPTSVRDAIEAAGAYTGPPRLLASGDLPGGDVLCEAEVTGNEGVRFAQENVGQVLSFDLREV